MLASPIHRNRRVTTSAARLANRRRFMQATNMKPANIIEPPMPPPESTNMKPASIIEPLMPPPKSTSETRVLEPNDRFLNFVDVSMTTPRSLYSLNVEETQAMLASFIGCNAYYDLVRKHYMKAISRKLKANALPLDCAHRFIEWHFDLDDIYNYIDTFCPTMA